MFVIKPYPHYLDNDYVCHRLHQGLTYETSLHCACKYKTLSYPGYEIVVSRNTVNQGVYCVGVHSLFIHY